MTHVAAVAIGGAFGAVLRYFAGVATLRLGFVTLPVGTFAVNVVGSFALGFLGQYFAPPNGSPTLFLGLTAGLCGGFTTFSAFSLDMLTMIERGQLGRAGLYALASVAISLGALAVGVLAARNLQPV